jgi:parallel beta-helix repeat protein
MTKLLKRSILVLALALACAGSSFATRVTITGGIVDQYHGTSVPTVARLESDREFSDSTGVRVPAGSGYNGFGQQFTVSIDGSGQITIASGSVYSTDDSSDPRARYTLAIYDAYGRLIRRLFATKGLVVPHTPNPTTWDALRIASEAATIVPAPTYPTTAQVNTLISSAISALSIETAVLSSSDLDTLIATANANPSNTYTGRVAQAVTLSTAKTIPSNLRLSFSGLGKFVKSSSGAITFQGLGLIDPASQAPVFSGFSSGNITWSGTAPTRLSANLWSDTTASARLNEAIGAVAGKQTTIDAYPGDIAAQVIVTTGLSVHLTKGTYTILSMGNCPFILQNSTTLYGDGIGQSIIVEGPFSAQIIRASGVVSGGFDGYNEKISVYGLTFTGNVLTPNDGASAAILLGNVHNGYVTYNSFYYTHGYAAYVGGFGTAGYTADGFWIEHNYMEGLQSQQIGTIGGKNGYIDHNTFINNIPASAPSSSTIDIEPNPGTDGSENLYITDNIFDSRGALQNHNAITVQRAGSTYMRNITIAHNKIFSTIPQRRTITSSNVDLTANTIALYGHGFNTGWPISFINDVSGDCGTVFPDLSSGCQTVYVIKVDANRFKIATSYANALAGTALDLSTSMGSNRFQVRSAAPLSNGIQLAGADNSTVEGNEIYGTAQNGILIASSSNIKVRGNILKLTGASGTAAIAVTTTSHSDFENNSVTAVPGIAGYSTSIVETDGTATVITTAGSPAILVRSDFLFPFNLAGLTITINGVDYVIGDVTNNAPPLIGGFQYVGLTLTTNALSNLTDVTATTHFSTNRYSNNDVGGITLSATGTSTVFSDYNQVKATLSGIETLNNKTLASPIITGTAALPTSITVNGNAQTFPTSAKTLMATDYSNTSVVPTLVAYKLTGVNFNSGNTDNAITIALPSGYTRYAPNLVLITHASGTLTTSTFGVFTGAGGTGTTIVASTANTVSTSAENTTNNGQSVSIGFGGSFNIATLYFRVLTPQGSAATADVTLVVRALP